MANAAARTGPGPTALVAAEQNFPKGLRLIDDDVAYPILPFGARAFVWLMRPRWARDWMVRVTERTSPGIWGGLVCRKRYIDDKLIQAAGEIGAMVNLGAGYDTRAYRLKALADIPVWEVDQPQNIEPKRARLKKLFGATPPHVTLVAIDFDREQLSTVLASHGYRAEIPTFFVWEAVSQYLTEEGVKATFDFLSKAAVGSRLAFTYVRKDFIDGHAMYGQAGLYKRFVKSQKAWRFGLLPEDVADFLAGYGWRVVEHLGYDELAERYVTPLRPELVSTPIERVVYAEKPGATSTADS